MKTAPLTSEMNSRRLTVAPNFSRKHPIDSGRTLEGAGQYGSAFTVPWVE
jgi:hypothetical protein